MRAFGFSLACVLLYAGPFLAGWMALDWQVLPVLAGIFLLWLVVMRPVQFPPAPPAAFVARLVATYAVQCGLAAICWGAGLLLAKVTPSPVLSIAWPFALSAVSIPLARAARAPATEESEEFLNEAVTTLERIANEIEADVERPDINPVNTGRVAAAMAELDCLSRADISLSAIDRVGAVFESPEEMLELIDAIRERDTASAPHLLADLVLSLHPDVISWTNYQAQCEPLMRVIKTDEVDLIDVATQAVLRMYDQLGTQAIHAEMPDQSVLLARAADLAERGQERSAQDLRAIYKAGQAAAKAYAAETGTHIDD